MRHQPPDRPLKLDGTSAAQAFFAGCFAECDPKRETLWVAHVNDRAHCLHVTQHEGDAWGVVFPFRQIILDAAQHGSAGIVLAHNHPSGNARPSEADLGATRRLASAVEALDCAVLDHLVFAGNECTSLRRLGLL